ncbi:MAG: TetR/AcrR family transcriptional regulator [Bacillota bacterium]|nr:TetR/AcrR family transcriptional regulator [Bacillota bacterium]
MKKNPEITNATRQAFVDAFCQLYKVQPIESITVTELTDKAGYNRCTFYRYFNDIYALLTYIENLLLEHIKKSIAEHIEIDDIIENFVPTFVKVFDDNDIYYKVLLDNPNSTRFADRLKTDMTPILMKKFRMPAEEPHAGYVMEFYLSALVSTIAYWVHHQKNISAAELGKMVQGFLENGVLSQLNKYKM